MNGWKPWTTQHILGLLNGWNIWKSRKNDQFAEVKIVVRAQPYSGAKRRRSLRSIFAAKKPIAIEVMEVSGNRVMTRSKLYRRLTTPNVPSITARSQPSLVDLFAFACFSSADFRPSLGPEPARCTKADFLCRDKPGLPESSLGRSQKVSLYSSTTCFRSALRVVVPVSLHQESVTHSQDLL